MPLPPVLAPFFAEAFQPISADFQLNAWSLLSILLAILAVHGHLRRKPSLDVDLSKLEAGLSTLQVAVERLTAAQARHANHEGDIAGLRERLSALERLRETDTTTQRSYIAKLSREIFEKIDGVEKSFSNNLQSVERTLGQIEGKIDVMRDRDSRP